MGGGGAGGGFGGTSGSHSSQAHALRAIGGPSSNNRPSGRPRGNRPALPATSPNFAQSVE